MKTPIGSIVAYCYYNPDATGEWERWIETNRENATHRIICVEFNGQMTKYKREKITL